VIDTERTIAEVAAELSVLDSSLARWARHECRRMENGGWFVMAAVDVELLDQHRTSANARRCSVELQFRA
jgi:hypothetical protein